MSANSIRIPKKEKIMIIIKLAGAIWTTVTIAILAAVF